MEGGTGRQAHWGSGAGRCSATCESGPGMIPFLLMMPWQLRDYIFIKTFPTSTASIWKVFTFGFQSDRKLAWALKEVKLSRRLISSNSIPLFNTKNYMHLCVLFYILSLSLPPSLYSRECSYPHLSWVESILPSILPSILLAYIYWVPTVCRGLAGQCWHSLCPHRVDCLVRKTNIFKK